MAEPSISMTFKEMYDKVEARFALGATDSKAAVNDGYQKFMRAWPWSFSLVTGTIAMVADTATTALPDNFGGMVEFPAYPANQPYRIRKQITTKAILDRQAAGSCSEYPYEFAIEAAAFTPATGQRYQIRWYPTPSANMTMTLTYRIIPAAMTSDSEYPMGGALHCQTILDLALAEAEQRNGETAGTYAQTAKESLAASITADQQMTGARVMGFIGAGEPQIDADRINVNYPTTVTES